MVTVATLWDRLPQNTDTLQRNIPEKTPEACFQSLFTILLLLTVEYSIDGNPTITPDKVIESRVLTENRSHTLSFWFYFVCNNEATRCQ